MAARFIGSLSLADVIPGAAAALARLNAAAGALSVALALQVPTLEGVGLSLEAAVLADVSAQLDAAVAAGVSLGVTAPDVALALKVQGAVAAIANLQVTPPGVQLAAMVSANLALQAQLEAKKLAFEALLEPMNLAIAALAALAAPLAAALAASAAFGLHLAAPGVRLYRVEANLNVALGQVDALVAAGQTAGLGANIPVQGAVLVVDAGDLTATAALNATFAGGP